MNIRFQVFMDPVGNGLVVLYGRSFMQSGSCMIAEKLSDIGIFCKQAAHKKMIINFRH
jgi:hypothetical protein